MNTPKTPHTREWIQTHFLIRVIGAAGVLLAGTGAVLISVGFWVVGVLALLMGGAGVAVLVVFEIQNAQQLVSRQRSTFGSNVLVQVLFATFLLIEINAISFFYYSRLDWTLDKEFSLPHEVREQLHRLKGETTIVVHLTHNFGQLSDKRDEYDHAAERLVIDKVEDLVEQFREFGPQFRVLVLDVKDKRYREKLRLVGEDSKRLADAIKSTNEDSIFILAKGKGDTSTASAHKVQRLGFQEIFQLDKKASQLAFNKKGNLVLHYQGVEPFARRMISLGERKPRIALGVIHEVLSTQGTEDLGMSGLRKALLAHGFEVRDIILKKWGQGAPQADVLTFDQSKYERLEEQIEESNLTIADLQKEVAGTKKLRAHIEKATLKQLTKEYSDQLGGRKFTEQLKERALLDLEGQLNRFKYVLKREEEDRDSLVSQQKKLNVADLAELRRISDVKTKLDRQLADCDLLILPRMTIFNVARGERIDNRLYQLDRAQVDAVRDFIKKGKPVLACFGPSNQPGNAPPDLMHGGSDGIEELFARMGIRFGREMVLYNVETKSFAERRTGLLILGVHVEVPPARFDWVPGGRSKADLLQRTQKLKPNPIAESMLLTVRGLDEKQPLDLKIRHPRPVSYQPLDGRKSKTDGAFLMSDANGWKEAQPFPSRERTPRPTEETRGQYPIGIAATVDIPAEWKGDKQRVRLAAMGHGGVFMGQQLSPVRQKLLQDTCNWLLGRDDLLNRKNILWEYPRIDMSPEAFGLWQWFARLGMPLIAGFIGVVVLLARSMR